MNEFRSRVLIPLAIPVGVFLGGGVFVYAFARVLLAVPKYWSVSLAMLLAAEILGIAAVLAAVRRIDQTQRVLVGALAAVVLVGGGFAIATGIRPIEAHASGVEVSALALQFDTDALNVPADTPFDLIFANNDAGIPHNVAIGTDHEMTEILFRGEIFNGVATKVEEVPALAAGEYHFHCDVHPDMQGKVIAGGEGAEGGHGAPEAGGEH